ncbi:hypothetical protein PoB_002517200 [Plakobranchus ocellatus]|uniref:Uncharacterized protein n=1 Tax=Plakobranchus ocellatus TaxID=259542 RepID=A0AAV3ZVG3_9GAST|nr:hypothetical protein PoB_002517200 [Plakobranchus ocellatus]
MIPNFSICSSSSHNVCLIEQGTRYGLCCIGVEEVNSMRFSSTVVEPGRSVKIDQKQCTSFSYAYRCSVDSLSSSFTSFTVSLLPHLPTSRNTSKS